MKERPHRSAETEPSRAPARSSRFKSSREATTGPHEQRQHALGSPEERRTTRSQMGTPESCFAKAPLRLFRSTPDSGSGHSQCYGDGRRGRAAREGPVDGENGEREEDEAETRRITRRQLAALSSTPPSRSLAEKRPTHATTAPRSVVGDGYASNDNDGSEDELPIRRVTRSKVLPVQDKSDVGDEEDGDEDEDEDEEEDEEEEEEDEEEEETGRTYRLRAAPPPIVRLQPSARGDPHSHAQIGVQDPPPRSVFHQTLNGKNTTPSSRYEGRRQLPVSSRYATNNYKSNNNSDSRWKPKKKKKISTSRTHSPRRRASGVSTDDTGSSSSSSNDSADEDRFVRRKARSILAGRSQTMPINVDRREFGEAYKERLRSGGGSLADIDPMSLDTTTTFAQVGGLEQHVLSLKEMVVFPLLYPEFFARFGIAAPRGCLFHGPPGTGKTLLARALANECSHGGKRVAFFMRKGADCLSKWVGESERQLRLLFDQAYMMRPAIIFFDEIDGLAPVRSSRQDQIHASIVSTLLALMDGLDDRGQVVVIGATNRIDSIDPALRRPGRFDREFAFALPTRDARRDIMRIHTRAWDPPLPDELLVAVADRAVGYCGADLKALTSEACLFALRRHYPQIYASSQKLVIEPEQVQPTCNDFFAAMQTLVPASARALTSPARPLTLDLAPLLGDPVDLATRLIRTLCPALTGDRRRRTLEGLDNNNNDELQLQQQTVAEQLVNAQRPSMTAMLAWRPAVLICPKDLDDPNGTYTEDGAAVCEFVGPAILHALEGATVFTISLATLLSDAHSRSPEESCARLVHEARRAAPCIIFLPRLNQLFTHCAPATLVCLTQLLTELHSAGLGVLLLATVDSPVSHLPCDIITFLNVAPASIVTLSRPDDASRARFFEVSLQPAFTPPSGCLIDGVYAPRPRSRPPKLAVAPALDVDPYVAAKIKAEGEHKRQAQEESDMADLRELRMFLREGINYLARERHFRHFSTPVSKATFPDYYSIIKSPCCLETMLRRCDAGEYTTPEAFLHDIECIVTNTIEYNPPNDPSRVIFHAHTLCDEAYSMIERLSNTFKREIRAIDKRRIDANIVPNSTTIGSSKISGVPSANGGDGGGTRGAAGVSRRRNAPRGQSIQRYVRGGSSTTITTTTSTPSASRIRGGTTVKAKTPGSVQIVRGHKIATGDDGNADVCAVCNKRGKLICCDRCPQSFHLACVGLKSLPRGDWVCHVCNEDENDDFCHVCHLPGNLLCCESCPRSFHLKCVGLRRVPLGDWSCETCETAKLNDDVCNLCGSLGELICCEKCPRAFHLACVNMTVVPRGEWHCDQCSVIKCKEGESSVRLTAHDTNPNDCEVVNDDDDDEPLVLTPVALSRAPTFEEKDEAEEVVEGGMRQVRKRSLLREEENRKESPRKRVRVEEEEEEEEEESNEVEEGSEVEEGNEASNEVEEGSEVEEENEASNEVEMKEKGEEEDAGNMEGEVEKQEGEEEKGEETSVENTMDMGDDEGGFEALPPPLEMNEDGREEAKNDEGIEAGGEVVREEEEEEAPVEFTVPPFVIPEDHSLQRVSNDFGIATRGYTVHALLSVRAQIASLIHAHSRDFDRTALFEAMYSLKEQL